MPPSLYPIQYYSHYSIYSIYSIYSFYSFYKKTREPLFYQ